MIATHRLLAIALVAAAGSTLRAAEPIADPYTPIPKGFDFPTPEAKLLALRDHGDLEAMRRHAWMLLAGLSQPARNGGPLF